MPEPRRQYPQPFKDEAVRLVLEHGYTCDRAGERLGRVFDAEEPNGEGVCDITYVPTGEGFLYLAVVMDRFSRKIVGWAMVDHPRAEPCTNALRMTIARRGLPPEVRLAQVCCTTAAGACGTSAETIRNYLPPGAMWSWV